MALILTLPFGDPVYHALVNLIARAKLRDPLAPVTVVVPSNYAGLSLRRRMGAQGGVVNVRFLVISRLAELLGAPGLSATRGPMSAWTRSRAIRASLVGHRGPLASVAGSPATARALDSTYTDLRNAPAGALAQLAATSSRGAEVAALYRRFRQLTEGYYEPEDLAEAASQAVKGGATSLADVGRVVLYLPRTLSPANEQLVRALLASERADIVLGVTHDRSADAPIADLAARLGAGVQPGLQEFEVATASHILRTIDAEEEVRSVIRLIVRGLEEGAALGGMGVLYSSSENYAGLIEEQFKAAEIPVHGPGKRTLADSMPGRVLLGLLRLPQEQFRRSDVTDWLTSGPIVELVDGEHARRWVPGRRWDELSRDAGVVRGMEQWRSRLRAWRDGTGRRDWEAAAAGRLLAFVEELEDRLRPPQPTTMPGLSRWALGLMDRYLGSENFASGWEEPREVEAYAELRKLLRAAAREPVPVDPVSGVELSELAGLDSAAALQVFTQALVALLGQSRGRLGRFGDGVFVGSLANARGMQFEQLFILGAAEGLLPATGHEDPLLPDAEREAAQLPGRDTKAAGTRADYLAALAGAERSTLCFSQSSLRAQAKQVPSRWLLESAARLGGEDISSETLEAMGSRPWLTAVASFEAALSTSALEPASSQEWELRSLLGASAARQHFLLSEPSFEASFQAMMERLPRWTRREQLHFSRLSPWAGGVGPGVAFESARTYSPTSFQTLATCAFRYFLGHVANVKETQHPEETSRISGAERGNLMHAILERFFRTRLGPQSERSEATDRQELLAITAEACDRVQESGVTGSELLWRMDRARIRRDLALFLEADAARRTETGAWVLAVERAFGPLGGEPGEEPPWPALTVLLDSDSIAGVTFRGRIDRVDAVEEGRGRRLIVYDYKSGGAGDYVPIEKALESGGDRLAAGRQLQLPIYAMAVRQALADSSTPVAANYWFVSERERFHTIGYELTATDEAKLAETLGILVGAVEGGTFPAVPGEPKYNAQRQKFSFEHCRFCAFDRVCAGGDRAEAWRERSGAEELYAYVALTASIPAGEQSGDFDAGD